VLPALELLAGAAIVSAMLLDVFRTVLVPGWTGRPLRLAAVEEGPCGAARLLYPLGCRTAREFADWYRLKPAAAEITRKQFDAALDRLAAAGYRLRDAETAWQAFLPLRAAYAGPVRSLAHFLAVSPARWL
jgi:hypothetical protein